MDEDRPKRLGEASLFSFVRFGPGSIVFLSFIAIIVILFYFFGQRTLALLFAGVGVLFCGVKSMERIQLSRIEETKLIGETCIVIKAVQPGRPGVVRILKPDGTPRPELWSAESAHGMEVGTKARVLGMKSVVLLIEPLMPSNGSTGTSVSVNN